MSGLIDKLSEVSSSIEGARTDESVVGDYNAVLEAVRKYFSKPDGVKVDERTMGLIARQMCDPKKAAWYEEMGRRKQRFLDAAKLDTNDKAFYNAQREFFLTFKTHTDQKHNIAARIQQGIQRFLPIEAIRRAGNYLSFLEIGPGDGEPSFPLMRDFRTDNVDFTIHEPNLGMAARFLMNYLLELQNIRRLHWHDNEGRKNFVCSKPEEFNFIRADHVLYYMPDLEPSLEAMFDSLAPGGVAAVVLTKKGQFLHRFREKFPDYFRDRNVCGQDVCDILDRRGIQYKRETLTSHLDVTDASVDLPSEDWTHLAIHGKNLICFMLRTNHHFAESEVRDRYKLIEFIRENSREPENGNLRVLSANMACNGEHNGCGKGHDFYYTKNGIIRRFAELTDDLIWIRKPGEYVPRNVDALHRGIEEDGYEQDVTVGDFKRFAGARIMDYIGKDLRGMDKGLVDAYVSFLVMDYFLSEPHFFELALESPFSPHVYEDRGTFMVGPKLCDDMKIIKGDMPRHGIHLEKSFAIDRSKYDSVIGNQGCLEYLDDITDLLGAQLPRESKAVLQKNGATFKGLVRALYQRFRHYEVISVDAFSQFNYLLEHSEWSKNFDVDLGRFISGYKN